MKRNVTLSAEERLIKSARRKAAGEGTSLNELFRAWISSYVQAGSSREDYNRLMSHLANVTPGRTFSRDELDER